MNEQQYSRARELGEQARRAGKSREGNPYKHGNSADLRALRDAWNQGYNTVDLQRSTGR